MPNIKGNVSVVLQPRDEKVGISILVPINTSPTSNDGYIPYGTTISGVTLTCYDDAIESAVVPNSDIVFSGPVVANNQYINTELRYPQNAGVGTYKLTYVLYLSDGGTRELDFDGVTAVDR